MNERSSFATYFNLKDPARTSFELDPKRDAGAYVDRSGEVKKLGDLLQSDKPFVVVEGDFGTGKSHLLRHLETVIAPKINAKVVFVTLSGFSKTSGFERLNEQVLDFLLSESHSALSEWCEASDGERLEPIEIPPDIVRALRDVGQDRDVFNSRAAFSPDAAGTKALAWLKGATTMAKSVSWGYSSTVWSHGPVALARMYHFLGKLYRQCHNRQLVLAIDETEALSRTLNSDARVSIGNGLRELFDDNGIGTVVGVYLPPHSIGINHPLMRSDIRSRLSNNKIRLEELANAEQTLDLLRSIANALSNDIDNSFRLSRTAELYVAEDLYRLRRYLEPSLKGAATPRDLIKVLSRIGLYCHQHGQPESIEIADVRNAFAMRDENVVVPGTLF